jgi:hypothetical protein
MQNKKHFASLVLVTAVLFGAVIRFAAPLNAQGPVNDGGLFLQMTQDLQTNHFTLPQYSAYNAGDIPFAYPPLGLYLVGFIQNFTGIPLIDLFTWLPALFSTIAILGFYFLALELTLDNLKSSVAALFYACVPKSFDWFIMGGGVTRAPAILFAFLTLAYVHKLFVTRQARYIFPVSIMSSLLVLTHPEIAYHTAFAVLIFSVFFLRDQRSFVHVFVTVLVVPILTSPWWFTVLQRYGIATFQTVLASHSRDFASQFLFRIQFNLGGEILLTIVGVFALIGLIRDVRQHDFFLPVWIAFGGLVVSLPAFILLAVKGFESTLKGLGDSTPFEDGFSMKTSRYTFLGLSTYLLMAGIIASSFYGYEFRILPGERMAMQWIRQNTEPAVKFVVVTGGTSLTDPLSEWFPVLAGRVSLATVQGHEWTPEKNLHASVAMYNQLQGCLNQEGPCLAEWDYDYVYIRKIKPVREGNVELRPSILDLSLRSSRQYQTVFEDKNAVIYQLVR